MTTLNNVEDDWENNEIQLDTLNLVGHLCATYNIISLNSYAL